MTATFDIFSDHHGPQMGIEYASRDEIIALQTARAKNELRHAYYNVPHYRRAFDEKGVHPDDFKELSDFALFPFTDKETLRAEYPFGMFAVGQNQISRIHASSGTTGRPTVVGYTENDVRIWAELVARSLRAGGLRKSDKVQITFGYGLFTGGLGAHYGVEALGATAIPTSGGQTERQIQIMQDFQPDAILGTPSYVLNLLDRMRKEGLDPRESSLRAGVFGAEPWSEGMRRELEEGFGITATDIYGLSEVMGPGVAQECVETKDGLTVWEDHFYPEIIDPETMQPVPDGEYGELVISSLTKEAFPIIRYRTHDITRLLPGTARSMRRIDRISARNDDMIILRGVNCFPSQFEEIITEDRLLRPRYQCVLSKRGRMDHLTLVVEHSSDATPDQIDASAQWLKKQIKERIGISVGVEITDHVDCGEGKAKRIVDNRDQ
ncbi:AMP-binding protein [Corynebacterium sp. UMB6689]|uniref:Phenylacetate-coenzyme A ligase n=2 Tax=Corynebacteriaceae TaxID=1653 RepID=A0A558GIT0_9CORY|nr:MULTISPECIES: AMP-binding protein [unclassified Corynebacterium]MBU5655281.1 AMP-binding protein [Corynebacterium aurimucosum]MDK6814328.1 AMP-binding protein [Corynebacterium sp. UMB6689]OFP23120.1 phenylacetate-CoA ligase [Corynebacterium sp. HMSC066C02]OFQ36594.1 phenylacetate-CoA ligase [Corynebacterium sp. HMSC072D12]OFS41476.1 phenylacetate-CoA ligase [Corynebacterium sp. HMSC069E04]